MSEWKLELQKDILNARGTSYPSIRERTAEYEKFYLSGSLREKCGKSRKKEQKGSAAAKTQKTESSLQYGTFYTQDERKTETPFSAMLALYGRDGNEYTFSRRGMRHMERELPWQGHYHTHDYIEILYVIHGSFEQILLGERQKFTQGEVVVTDRNLEHADYLSGEENTAVLFLSMQSGYLDRLLMSCDPVDDLQQFLFHALKRQRKEQSYLHLTPSGITEVIKKSGRRTAESADEKPADRRARMERVLELLVSEDWNPAEGTGEIIKGALIRLFSLLCQSYSMKLHSSDRESREKIFLYELERYIRQMQGQVDAAALEEIFHYHRNYFTRILRKYRGMTFREYTQKIRLDHAASLLAGTSMSVREAAARAGWHNSSHFYHLFEERYGMSPADYRSR